MFDLCTDLENRTATTVPAYLIEQWAFSIEQQAFSMALAQLENDDYKLSEALPPAAGDGGEGTQGAATGRGEAVCGDRKVRLSCTRAARCCDRRVSGAPFPMCR